MRLGFAGDCPCLVGVSIHASVKDATYAERHHTFDPVVSIHASVKDATRFDVNVRYDALFQSTHL